MKLCVAVAIVIVCVGAADALAVEPSPAPRYPLAAVRLGDEGPLAVANARSGTISLVARRSVTDEVRVGERLSDLTFVPVHGLVLATDPKRGTLTSLVWNGKTLDKRAVARVGDDPRSVVATRDGSAAFVATRWSRKLEFFGLGAGGKLRREHVLSLPFPANKQLLLPGDKHLLVADAFGGHIALIDIERRAIVGVREISAHNISALACDAAHDRVLVAHQILNPKIPVDYDNVQWGALLKNVVRILPREMLFDEKANLSTATRVISLGQEGDGSADPTAVAPLAEGGFAVTLGGADELVIVESTGIITARMQLGRRPLALVANQDASELVAVNQFDNSLSFIDVARGHVSATLSLGPAPKLSATERGEQLFYDARLSLEKWMSCHSCHPDGHTTGQLADTLGDGNFGAPKRTLTLLGTRDTDRWAWNGEMKELSEQVRKSVETSMHGHATAEQVFDLTAYLHTLEPPPPLLPGAVDEADRTRIARGEKVFERERCSACHIPPLTFTSHDVYDVGLPDEHKQAKFNPPSLRGVGQGQSFLHDARATRLEDVFDVYGHQLRGELTNGDRADLLRL